MVSMPLSACLRYPGVLAALCFVAEDEQFLVAGKLHRTRFQDPFVGQPSQLPVGNTPVHQSNHRPLRGGRSWRRMGRFGLPALEPRCTIHRVCHFAKRRGLISPCGLALHTVGCHSLPERKSRLSVDGRFSPAPTVPFAHVPLATLPISSASPTKQAAQTCLSAVRFFFARMRDGLNQLDPGRLGFEHGIRLL